MCRHLAYLGPPVALSALLLDPPHSLLHQSYAPRDMRGGGTINADGYGVGWYEPGRPAPVRYRRAVPMWTDSSFVLLTRGVHSGAVLAAVRSATPGMPVIETACAPFTADRWLFSLNGRVAGWPGTLAGLAAELPVTDLLTLDAPTDSAVLWALARRRLRAGQPAAQVVEDLVAQVGHGAPGSRLNLLLSDGEQIVGSTASHALSFRRDGTSVLVASEPTDDDPGWVTVPEGHLLVATPSTHAVTPIRTEEP